MSPPSHLAARQQARPSLPWAMQARVAKVRSECAVSSRIADVLHHCSMGSWAREPPRRVGELETRPPPFVLDDDRGVLGSERSTKATVLYRWYALWLH